eukprot:UN30806
MFPVIIFPQTKKIQIEYHQYKKQNETPNAEENEKNLENYINLEVNNKESTNNEVKPDEDNSKTLEDYINLERNNKESTNNEVKPDEENSKTTDPEDSENPMNNSN